MTNDQHASPKAHEQHTDIAIASIWLLLLAAIVAIELGSLLMSHSMLAAVLS